MTSVLENYVELEARIEHGSVMVAKSKYPFMTFLFGFLFSRIPSVDKLFSTVESLQFLVAEDKLSSIYQQQLFYILFERPEKHHQIHDLLDKIINNENVQVLVELSKLQNDEEEERHGLEKSKTVELQNNFNTEEIWADSKYLEEQQRLNKESEAFARKLQQEYEQQAKKSKVDEEAVCEICYVGLYEQDFIPLENCEHIFHKNCLSQAFKAQISENKFPLKCADDTCQVEVKDNDIKQVLEETLYVKYQKHTLKFYADTNGDTTSWCPTADCEYMFFFDKDDETRFECPECKKQYCLNCRVQWHKDMSCKEFQITNTTTDDDLKFMNFVKGKKFKQCPKCKFWVEKNQGCDHMTCKCRFQFCYKCGGNFGKCQCVEKAQAEMRRRMELAEQRRRKKEERKRNAGEKKPRRRGR